MTTKTKDKPYLKDKVASILFTSKDTREYTESVIAASLNLPLEVVKNNLVLQPARVNNNVNVQYSEVDALYENDDSVINIEINYFEHKMLKTKNMKYICHLYLNQTKINDYKNIKPIYQICINNYDEYKKNKFVYKSTIMEETLHEKRENSINIIDINVDFLRNMDYTEIERKDKNSLERLLYVFVCNDKEKRNKLYVGDDVMKKVEEKLSVLTEDFANELYYDKEEIVNAYSYDLGIENGKNEQKLEIAKRMLRNNKDISEIIEYTDLTKEDIEKLK